MTANTLPKSLIDHPELRCWLSFAETNVVQARSGKVELGQGIATALAQIVAEELELPLASIRMVPADTDGAPDEGLTAGSQSVEVSGAALRLAAAQARSALLDAGARRLGSERRLLAGQNGTVTLPESATVLTYWELAAEVDWSQHVTGTVPVRASRNHAIVGTSIWPLDMIDRVTRGGFIQDSLPADVLHARIIRQPFRLAQLDKVDRDWLGHRYPDVAVLQKADFLALTADDEFVVCGAHLDAEKFVTWTEVPNRWVPARAADAKHLTQGETPTPSEVGLGIDAHYARASLAHASIAPSCALARYRDDRLTIWSHSQGIFPLRVQVARCLGLPVGHVHVVHVPGAGCYGHNGADDAALDAAIVALANPGRIIRVLWSRADELSRAPLGARMSSTIKANLDQHGRIASWQAAIVSAPHAQRPGFGGNVNLSSAEALDTECLPKQVDDLPEAAGGGASRNAVPIYDVAHLDVNVTLDTSSPVRTSSLRALGAHLNVFAIESAMDELANLAGIDPLAFRLNHLPDPRCRAVLKGVAAMADWHRCQEPRDGRALGIGVARYKNKGAWLAAIADVAVGDEVEVCRLWLCVDAGLLINPAGARNQIEGGAIQAVSWSIKESIRHDNDRIPPLTWDEYPILKFSEIPAIETRFIADPNQPPLGVGEAALGPVAAAIGNAASRALGVRLRDLPLSRERLMASLLAD